MPTDSKQISATEEWFRQDRVVYTKIAFRRMGKDAWRNGYSFHVMADRDLGDDADEAMAAVIHARLMATAGITDPAHAIKMVRVALKQARRRLTEFAEGSPFAIEAIDEALVALSPADSATKKEG